MYDNVDVNAPKLLSFFARERLSLRDVVCGGDHSFALTNDGAAYAWGFLQHGVACDGIDGLRTQLLPRRVDALRGVSRLECGLDTTFAIFDDVDRC